MTTKNIGKDEDIRNIINKLIKNSKKEPNTQHKYRTSQ